MLVGLGGNNGSTLTASLIANRHKLSWQTREGTQQANWLGSMLMSSCAQVGKSHEGQPVHLAMSKLVPMVNPDDIVIGGWDIYGANLAAAMDKACVLEPQLKD